MYTCKKCKKDIPNPGFAKKIYCELCFGKYLKYMRTGKKYLIAYNNKASIADRAYKKEKLHA